MTPTARPTMYRGVRMRSIAEAEYAQSFDAYGLEWRYEPLSFVGNRWRYTPDFLIRDPARPDREAWVEVKHEARVMDRDGGLVDVLDALGFVWQTYPDARLVLAVARYAPHDGLLYEWPYTVRADGADRRWGLDFTPMHLRAVAS